MFKKIWNGIKKVVKGIVRVVRSVVGGTALVGGLAVACVGGVVTTKPVLDSVFKVMDKLTEKPGNSKTDASDDTNDISDTKKEDEANVQEDI